MITKGELPERRTYIRRYLTEVRQALIRDLGPTEDKLTSGQTILIDRVTTKLGVIRCIEEYIRETSVMEGKKLAPSLRENYLAYNNSVRLDLKALGVIDIKDTAGEFDVLGYVKRKYARGKKNDRVKK